MKRSTDTVTTRLILAVFVTFALLVSACTTAASVTSSDSPSTTNDDQSLSDGRGVPDELDEPGSGSGESKPEPQPYLPAGSPGSAEAYAETVDRLEALVPVGLQNQVPWPDLRNPNPIVAQVEIFELWIWMAEHVPEPELVEIMAAPGSPSREEIVSIFGSIQISGLRQRRVGDGYNAYDHTVVTFESAGLPLWLAMDVPDDAVVVYYSDSSGPVERVDATTGDVFAVDPATGERRWLSIMVPTEVGWQLYRDELIDPSRGLETPDVPPPSDDSSERQVQDL